jgi:hypothetical protein
MAAAFSNSKKRFRNHLRQRCDSDREVLDLARLNETGRSEAPHYQGMGSVGPTAVGRFRWGNRPRFAKILRGAGGRAITSFEFPDKGPRQMANRPRLAGGLRADSLIADVATKLRCLLLCKVKMSLGSF